MNEYDFSESLPEDSVSLPWKKIITSLRLIFWGALICLIHIKINQFDIINDFIGKVMIMCAILSLAKITVSPTYKSRMFYNSVVVVIATILSFFSDVVFPLSSSQPIVIQNDTTFFPTFLVTVAAVINLCFIWGWFWFCLCMKEFCEQRDMERCAASWEYSKNLVFYVFFIPACLGQLLLIFVLPGRSVTPSLGPFVLLALIIFFFVAWVTIHFLISISRMMRAIRDLEPSQD